MAGLGALFPVNLEGSRISDTLKAVGFVTVLGVTGVNRPVVDTPD